MVKRILISLLIIPIIGFLVYFYFSRRAENTSKSEILDAIPQNFSWILQINNSEKLMDELNKPQSSVIKWFIKNPSNFIHHSLIDSVSKFLFAHKMSFKNSKMAMVALDDSASTSFEYIFEINSDKTEFVQAFENDFVRLDFKNIKGFQFKLKNKDFYLFIKNSLVVVSTNQELLSRSYQGLDEKTKWHLANDFKQLWLAQGSDFDASFISKYENLSKIIPNYFDVDFFQIFGQNKEGWMVNSFDFNGDLINLKGLTEVNFEGDLFNKLTKQEPIEISSIRKFPIGISSSKTIGLSNPSQFLPNDSSSKKIDFFGTSFNEWYLGEKFCEASIVKYKESNLLVLLKQNDSWKWMMDSSFYSKTDDVFLFEGIKNEVQNLFGNKLNEEFNNCKIFENYIVFSSNPFNLNLYLNQVKFNETLGNSELVNLSDDILKVKSNFVCISKNITKKPANSSSTKFYEYWSDKNEISMFEISANKKHWDYSFVLKNNEVKRNNFDLLFSIDSKFQVNNAILFSSKKGEQIVCYDGIKSLQSYDLNGDLIWNADLSDAVKGEINIVKFPNEKKVLIFNTSKKLYAINEKGQSVKGFPVIFESKATAGVIIYSNIEKEEYRMTIPFENNTILNFDGTGKVLEDWNKKPIKNKITNAFFAFKNGDERNYISIGDSSSLIVLNRKGKVKINKDTIFTFRTSTKKVVLNKERKPVFFELDSLGNIGIFNWGENGSIKISTGLTGTSNFAPIILNKENYFVLQVGSKKYLLNEQGNVISQFLFTKNIQNYNVLEDKIIWFDGKKNLVITNGKIESTIDCNSDKLIFALNTNKFNKVFLTQFKEKIALRLAN